MTPARSGSRARRRSAGLLLYRRAAPGLQVLLVHPGGPLWARRDLGAWSIPKGEYADDEDPLAAARREFEEELGSPPPGPVSAAGLLDLGEIRQKSGKLVHAWALPGDLDLAGISSNTFAMEWPPRSGQLKEFPEVDRAQWFDPDEARAKLNPAQVALLERLQEALGDDHPEAGPS
jgi:predicted NUDIX family NTP pyrophosphohydrolase